MKTLSLLFIIFGFSLVYVKAQQLSGFRISGYTDEQQLVIEDDSADTRVLINAPLHGFGKNNRVLLVFFALPNGNSIEYVFDKNPKSGDNWHFNGQHIGAQTRFLRKVLKNQTVVVAYLETRQKSWPAWKAVTPDYRIKVKDLVDRIKSMFSKWNPEIVLNGHSGGGRFVFSYLDAVDKIPDDVVRIGFLDSNYGYDDTDYGQKLTDWLKSGKKKFLCTLAYNDSVVIYNGKPLVSPTGGTWYRSKLMQHYLSDQFRFRKTDRDSLIWYSALKGRIEIVLKTNPDKKIFHTVQVDRNGFIHSMLSGTKYESKGYTYFGGRAYSQFIADTVFVPIRQLNIPERNPDAEPGSVFMKRIATLPLKEREEEIYKSVVSGNVPQFLRNTITLNADFADSTGRMHKIVYEAMPDYLAVGSDHDFCRIPMNSYTAQRIATVFGASLLTARLSDHIYKTAPIKLVPFNYIPVGNANELVTKFEDHNTVIEKQFAEAKGIRGQLVAGIKKDVILSERIACQPGKVVIYGWHKPGGNPIQPVYSGHVWWYVDYSHGIRLVNNQVLVDGKPALLSEILKDPLLYKLFSDEKGPMQQTIYNRN